MNNKDKILGEEPRVLTWQGSESLPTIPVTNFAVYMLEEMTRVAAESDGALALVDAETGMKRTYSELCELVPRVSAGLAAAGLGQGDRVLCYSPSHIDYPLVFLSVLHRGATVVQASPVYEELQEDLLHTLRVSGARWAVVHAELLDKAETAFSLLPPNTLKKVWVIGDAADKPTLEGLAAHEPMPPVTQVNGLNPSTALTQIPFSSGTTGPRKGVMISHINEISIMMRVKHLAAIDQWFGSSPHHSTCLLVTALSHIYGHAYLYSTLLFGGTAILVPHFSLSSMVQAIKEHQVTLAILTPFHLKMMADSPDVQQQDLSSLKAICCGGAPLTGKTVTSFKKKADVLVCNLWGLTEVTFSIRGPVGQDWKMSCQGKVLPYIELKVVDINNRQMLGAGQLGELCVRSPSVMLGYINNPAATSAVIDEEGWFHTGDYGYYDCQDFVHLTDRVKELIKIMGHLQVQPSDLEILLLQHPDVTEAVVVGVSNEDFEEMPRAFVVLERESPVQPYELQQFVNKRVPAFKQLTGGVWIVRDIPKNGTGKALKRYLKDGKVTTLASC